VVGMLEKIFPGPEKSFLVHPLGSNSQGRKHRVKKGTTKMAVTPALEQGCSFLLVNDLPELSKGSLSALSSSSKSGSSGANWLFFAATGPSSATGLPR